MAEEKPSICIAYREVEEEIGNAFRDVLVSGFRNTVDIKLINMTRLEQKKMLSSDIKCDLGKCSALVLIVGPNSCSNNLLFFLGGIGWTRNIAVVSLCHSDMALDMLPFPLTLLPAVKAGNFANLNTIFPIIANAVGQAVPRVTSAEFIQKVEQYERKHLFWDKCNEILQNINSFDTNLMEQLKQLKPISLNMTESESQRFYGWLPFLRDHNLMDMEKTGYIALRPEGIFYSHKITPLTALYNILNDENLCLEKCSQMQ